MNDDLLRAAVAGDPTAVDALLRQHWPDIHRWCRIHVADRVLADDAAQEAVVRVMRSIHQVDPTRPLLPWLRRVVATACIDLLRRRGRHPHVASLDLPDDRAVDRAVDLQRAADRAVEAFADLPDRQRALITAVDLQGERASEVAARLGLSAGAVRNQLHTARRRIREVLTAQGIHDLLRGA
jgi:RNA polymerase sigma-70 factor (ECF subfamily)